MWSGYAYGTWSLILLAYIHMTEDKMQKIISLAKRFEEIYTPDKTLPLSLPKESPARQLAQAIRDEAHRFALTYHRLLRSKKLLES